MIIFFTLFLYLPNIILYLWIAGPNNRNTLCSDLWDLAMMFYYNIFFCFLTFEKHLIKDSYRILENVALLLFNRLSLDFASK